LASVEASINHWHRLFDLAWNARRGLVINLKDVHDHIVDHMITWANDYNERGVNSEL
jgi:hypothetical protein